MAKRRWSAKKRRKNSTAASPLDPPTLIHADKDEAKKKPLCVTIGTRVYITIHININSHTKKYTRAIAYTHPYPHMHIHVAGMCTLVYAQYIKSSACMRVRGEELGNIDILTYYIDAARVDRCAVMRVIGGLLRLIC